MGADRAASSSSAARSRRSSSSSARSRQSALSYHERYARGQDIVVGVNKYVTDTVDDVDILRVDPESERAPARAARRVQGRPRRRARRDAPRGAARGRPRRRQPALPDQGRAARRRLDRRGLRRDARRVRRVPGRRVLLAPWRADAWSQEVRRTRGGGPKLRDDGRTPSGPWSSRRPSCGSSSTMPS